MRLKQYPRNSNSIPLKKVLCSSIASIFLFYNCAWAVDFNNPNQTLDNGIIDDFTNSQQANSTTDPQVIAQNNVQSMNALLDQQSQNTVNNTTSNAQDNSSSVSNSNSGTTTIASSTSSVVQTSSTPTNSTPTQSNSSAGNSTTTATIANTNITTNNQTNSGLTATVSDTLPDNSHMVIPTKPFVLNDPNFVRGHLDAIPDFAANPDFTITESGKWSDITQLSKYQGINENSVILIGSGANIEFDATEAEGLQVKAIGVKGVFRFKTDVDPTRATNGKITYAVKLQELLVYKEGTLEIGTELNPVHSDVTAKITIGDKALDTYNDPEQFGNGLIAFGTVRMHGYEQSETFARTYIPSSRSTSNNIVDPRQKNVVILENVISGWRAGDRLAIPDTNQFDWRTVPKMNGRQYNGKWEDNLIIEKIEIQTIDGIDRTVITLEEDLKHDHLGAWNGQTNQVDFTPHLVNLTRNVIIESENPDASAQERRGHTMYLGRADIDVRYVQHKDLGRTKNEKLDTTIFKYQVYNTQRDETYTIDVTAGKIMTRELWRVLPSGHRAVIHGGQLRVVDRNGNDSHMEYSRETVHIGTNQIARYAIHTHHLTGPTTAQTNGHQFTLIGNSVDNHRSGDDINSKWAITIHGSHYGLIQKNTVYNISGSAIVTEDGTETGNVFDSNFVLRSTSRGSGWRKSDEGLFGITAREAGGLWFKGVNNYVRNNVVANIFTFDQANTAFGFKYYNVGNTRVRIPVRQGVDSHSTNGSRLVNMEAMPILQFENNEVYGATQGALSYWNIGLATVNDTNLQKQTSVFKGLKAWNVSDKIIYHYPSANILIEDFVVRGDGVSGGTGMTFGDYASKNAIIRNADIQGVQNGIITSSFVRGHTVIEDSYFRVFGTAISIQKQFSVNGSANVPDKQTYIVNSIFDSWNGSSRDINLSIPRENNLAQNYLAKDEVFVYGYNGDPAANFQVFYQQQHPDFLLPQDVIHWYNGRALQGRYFNACPEGGMTNAGCSAKYSGRTDPTDPNYFQNDNGQVWDTYAFGGEIAPCRSTGDPSSCVALDSSNSKYREMFVSEDSNGNSKFKGFAFKGALPPIPDPMRAVKITSPRTVEQNVIGSLIDVQYDILGLPANTDHLHFCFHDSIPLESDLNSLDTTTNPSLVMDTDMNGSIQLDTSSLSAGMNYLVAWPVDSTHQYAGQGFTVVPVAMFDNLDPPMDHHMKMSQGSTGTFDMRLLTSRSTPVAPILVMNEGFNFNEGTGNSLTNSQFTGNIHGASWDTGFNGQGHSLNFDGQNDYVDLGNFDVSRNAITLSAWIKPERDNMSDRRIISKATGFREQDHIFMLSTVRSNGENRLRFRLKTGDDLTIGTSTLVANSGNLVQDQWHHVAATYDGQEMKLFLDGVEVGSMNKSGLITQSSDRPVFLGINPGHVSLGSRINPWIGSIDELGIFNQALSATEIQNLINSDLSTMPPPVVTPTPPVSSPAPVPAPTPPPAPSTPAPPVDSAPTPTPAPPPVDIAPIPTPPVPAPPTPVNPPIDPEPPVDNTPIEEPAPPVDEEPTLIDDGGVLIDDFTPMPEFLPEEDQNEEENFPPITDIEEPEDEEDPLVFVPLPIEPILPTPPIEEPAPPVDEEPTLIDDGGVLIDDFTPMPEFLPEEDQNEEENFPPITDIEEPEDEEDPLVFVPLPIEPIQTPTTTITQGFSFDEASGNSISNSEVTGAIHGATFDTGHQDTGTALRFDGNNYVDLGDVDFPRDAVTVSAWIKSDISNTEDKRILSKSTTWNNQDHIFMLSTIRQGGENRLRFRLKTGINLSSGTNRLIANRGNIIQDTWHHVAATYDGSMMRLYLDGEEVGSMSHSGPITQASGISTFIGMNPGGENAGVPYSGWDGLIDELGIFDRALSEDEIKALGGFAVDELPSIDAIGEPETLEDPFELVTLPIEPIEIAPPSDEATLIDDGGAVFEEVVPVDNTPVDQEPTLIDDGGMVFEEVVPETQTDPIILVNQQSDDNSENQTSETISTTENINSQPVSVIEIDPMDTTKSNPLPEDLIPIVTPSMTSDEIARNFFTQFMSTDKNTLHFTPDYLPGNVEISYDNQASLSQDSFTNLNIYPGQGGHPDLTKVMVDNEGRRFIRQIGGRPGLDLGYWVAGGRDTQVSDLYPSALLANRMSFTIRIPDEFYDSENNLISIHENPILFATKLGYHRGQYNQDDGHGTRDYDPEDNNWHFYWWLSTNWQNLGKTKPKDFNSVLSDAQALFNDLLSQGYINSEGYIQDKFYLLNDISEFQIDDNLIMNSDGEVDNSIKRNIYDLLLDFPTDLYNIKVESLGDNFQRITFNDQITGTRNGRESAVGLFGPVNPNLSSFKGDRTTTFRSETRYYWTFRYPDILNFAKTDNFTNDNDFDDGAFIWDLYGISFWYEDPGVELSTFPPEGEKDTPFVQLLVSTDGPQYEYIPFEIRNTSDQDARYRVMENITPDTPNHNPLLDSTIDAFGDINDDGILSEDEIQNNHLGPLTPIIPAGQIYKGIIRVDTRKLNKDTTDNLGLTVNLFDVNNPMNLKGDSIHIHTYKADDISELNRENVFFVGGPGIDKPTPIIPDIEISATDQDGNTLSHLAEVTAGTRINLEAFSADPNIVLDNRNDLAYRFYRADGRSKVGRTIDGITVRNLNNITVWEEGINTFVLQIGNGTSRVFKTISLVVKPARDVAPVAKINFPSSNTSFKAGEPVLFTSMTGEAHSFDPDGGSKESSHGISQFEWDFGDGSPISYEQFPEHIFASPEPNDSATYTVQLRVKDEEGNYSLPQTIDITIHPPNTKPVARLKLVNPDLFEQYGIVEINAQGTIDDDGPDDIAGFRWKIQGPNGFTERANQLFIEDSSKLLFDAWEAGQYTVTVTAYDKSFATDTTQISFDVLEWKGGIKANVIASDSGPGKNFFNFDVDNVEHGWTSVFGGLSYNRSAAKLGSFNDKEQDLALAYKIPIRNSSVPVNTPDNLDGVFSSAHGEASRDLLGGVGNLEPGKYRIKVFLYDDVYGQPGTQMGIRIGSRLSRKGPNDWEKTYASTIKLNATYEDYILEDIIDHTGGSLNIQSIGKRDVGLVDNSEFENIVNDTSTLLFELEEKGYLYVTNRNREQGVILQSFWDLADFSEMDLDPNKYSIENKQAIFNKLLEFKDAIASPLAGFTLEKIDSSETIIPPVSSFNVINEIAYTPPLVSPTTTSGSQTTASRLSSLTPSDTTLNQGFSFDETSGDRISNSEVTGIIRRATFDTGHGNTGTALRFNGVDSYVDLGDADFPQDAVTVSAWVKSDIANTIDRRILSKATSFRTQDHIFMLSTKNKSGENRLRFRLKTGNDFNDTTKELIADRGNIIQDTWHHVAATYDGSMMRLYLDGEEVGSMSHSGPITQASGISTFIGMNPGGNNEGELYKGWNGLIDDLGIFDRALSEDEIKALGGFVDELPSIVAIGEPEALEDPFEFVTLPIEPIEITPPSDEATLIDDGGVVFDEVVPIELNEQELLEINPIESDPLELLPEDLELTDIIDSVSSTSSDSDSLTSSNSEPTINTETQVNSIVPVVDEEGVTFEETVPLEVNEEELLPKESLPEPFPTKMLEDFVSTAIDSNNTPIAESEVTFQEIAPVEIQEEDLIPEETQLPETKPNDSNASESEVNVTSFIDNKTDNTIGNEIETRLESILKGLTPSTDNKNTPNNPEVNADTQDNGTTSVSNTANTTISNNSTIDRDSLLQKVGRIVTNLASNIQTWGYTDLLSKLLSSFFELLESMLS